jgi:hypothetical protein
MRSLEEIVEEAMHLDSESRAAVAKRLLDSLEDLTAEEHGRLWVEESARRYQEILEGEARTIPAEEVFAKLADRAK